MKGRQTYPPFPSMTLSGGHGGADMVVVCLGSGRTMGQGAWLTMVQVAIVDCRVILSP